MLFVGAISEQISENNEILKASMKIASTASGHISKTNNETQSERKKKG